MHATHRSAIALAAAAVLSASGVIIIGQSVADPESPSPGVSVPPPPPARVDPRSTELERAVSDLLAQVDGLEAAVAVSAEAPETGAPEAVQRTGKPTRAASTPAQTAVGEARPAAAVSVPPSTTTADDPASQPEETAPTSEPTREPEDTASDHDAADPVTDGHESGREDD